ncbi:MAG: O-antigen ligase family protein [Richelia sp. RM2_1_2]|nr:O-antigen ligase family protein [Richelia sp. SM1_7_0]NJN11347.1 O-antigen ligase family protein [Richelia sp. RM1_1_1]NJO30082.1 O-antigen ligase family protein [Richelia sp. SL_2_1]NJO61767.1 O-antigen ligase family protein [Richelia sp. RM2_1_2]
MNKKYLEIGEKCFAVLALTFFSGGLMVGANLTSSPITPGIIPPSIISLIRYFIWIGSIVLIGLRWKQSLIVASRDLVLWILVVWILLSYIWSDLPTYTSTVGREVWQMNTFALYFASRFNLKEQVRLVAWTFGIGSLLTLFFALGFPSIGKHGADHPGSWKGIYDYKNTLGSMMLIGSLSFFLLPVDNAKQAVYKWLGICLPLSVIVLSNSKTAIVVCFLLAIMLVFYRTFRWQGKISVIFLDLTVLVVGIVGTFILTNWAELLGSIGKDPTLTGRTPMWGMMIKLIMEKPWLGYGRGAFWAPGTKYPAIVGGTLSSQFIAPHGHNGYLDFALDVGLIGLGLFLFCFILGFFRAMKRAYAAKSPEEIWPLAFLLFLGMNNIMESYILRLANVYWVLFVAAILSAPQRKPVILANKFNNKNLEPATLKRKYHRYRYDQ